MEDATIPQNSGLIETDEKFTFKLPKSKLVNLTVGLVILLIGFGAGFHSRNFFPEAKPTPPLEEPTAETQARFDKENEEYVEKLKQIENWTPYVNKEYGFSFEHPKDWILEGKIFKSASSKESLSVMINTSFGIECYDKTSTIVIQKVLY